MGGAHFWIDGVVEPLSGWHFTAEEPHLDGENFQQLIDALSLRLGDDLALIQLDQAGVHLTSALRWAENLRPICQPAHSPELNFLERVWQLIKAQLKGEHFATIEALREPITQVMAQIAPERIISLSSYDLILAALFYAASH